MTAAPEQAREGRDAASFVAIFAGIGAAGCLMDFWWVGGGPWVAWGMALGLGCAGGALVGSLWYGLLEVPARLHLRRPVGIWIVTALVYTLWLSLELGVLARFGSRYHGLAVLGLVASVAAGLGIYMLTWMFGRRYAEARPPWARETPTRGRALRVALCGVAVVATLVDRSFFPQEHPAAHATLRVATLSVLGLAATSFPAVRPRSARHTLGFLGAVVLALLPFTIMGGPSASRVRGLFAAPTWVVTLRAAPTCAQALTALRRLTDVDADGFSHTLWGGDCAAWDGDVSPGATDIPNDGIDQDCSGVDAEVHIIDPASTFAPEKPSPRSVLLVTVDTLRADHMSLFGYPKQTSPALDRRASRLQIFERAYSTGPWTSIAIPTLLRGVYARRLRWEPYFETNEGRMLRAQPPPKLMEKEQPLKVFMLPEEDSPPPLPWWLQRRGMVTMAVADDRYSELLDPSTGIAVGFDVFVEGDEVQGPDPDDAVVDRAIEALEGVSDDEPWFLWVHLFGPHAPSTRHPSSPTFGVGVVADYDHEIHFADAQIDRLIDAAIRKDSKVAYIVTADHGETLLPNARHHGFKLTDDLIRVPLLLGGAGLPAGRVTTPVSTVDIVPTILELTETPAPAYLDGRSLLGGLEQGRMLYSDVWRHREDGSLHSEKAAALDGSVRYVVSGTENAGRFTDLQPSGRSQAGLEAAVDLQRYVRLLHEYREKGVLVRARSPDQKPEPERGEP